MPPPPFFPKSPSFDVSPEGLTFFRLVFQRTHLNSLFLRRVDGPFSFGEKERIPSSCHMPRYRYPMVKAPSPSVFKIPFLFAVDIIPLYTGFPKRRNFFFFAWFNNLPTSLTRSLDSLPDQKNSVFVTWMFSCLLRIFLDVWFFFSLFCNDFSFSRWEKKPTPLFLRRGHFDS